MNMFTHGRLGHFLMAETTEGEPGSTATPPATPPADSLLATGAAPDFIPEKYQVKKEDGSLDLEQSSRKLAESYKHLETRLGSGDAPPKTAEEYTVKLEGVEGFDWDEFKADPDTQSFLKGAHSKGLTNDQVQYVIGEYMKAAPNLIGGAAQLTQQDCTAALKAVWGDDQTIRTNVSASYRAAEAFASQGDAPGNFNALMTKYGNDPDFIAFTANIGKELKEDSAINGGAQVSEADFAVKTSELRQQLQDLPAHDPKRPGIQAQLDALYNRKYSPTPSRF
ncbi:hypothetical protein FX985_00633 [Pseudomonas extremaustralis]|uniref:Uncharacterized protein n=1 Tax=Pseudomonas extremaustralis TaxID=359110 RepID=A0A5M9IWP3_9PSED|nr:hypothetical protein [Pseudomonas extremaustralis]KAA8560583.1 hypothetical protein FX985_00633 [Pseudomonas extremaustralis]